MTVSSGERRVQKTAVPVKDARGGSAVRPQTGTSGSSGAEESKHDDYRDDGGES